MTTYTVTSEPRYAKDQEDYDVDVITSAVLETIPNEGIAYQFVLEEIEGASLGNEDARRFAENSVFLRDEYEDAMKDSSPEVDGYSGPQASREGFETVDELKRAVKIDLQGHKDRQEELKIKEDIFNMLVKQANALPPESIIERELKFMIEGMKFQIAQSGMKIEDSGFEPEKAHKEWREKAIFNTKGYMALESVAQAENIHITQQDMEAEYELLAQQTKQKVEDIQKRLMSNPESLSQTTTKLLGQKTMNFIFSSCEFEYYKGELIKE